MRRELLGSGRKIPLGKKVKQEGNYHRKFRAQFGRSIVKKAISIIK